MIPRNDFRAEDRENREKAKGSKEEKKRNPKEPRSWSMCMHYSFMLLRLPSRDRTLMTPLVRFQRQWLSGGTVLEKSKNVYNWKPECPRKYLNVIAAYKDKGGCQVTV